MAKLVWFNGNVMPLESATVSAADHAHLYGDGLFEGIRFYNRKVFKLDPHLDRLYHGCAALGFKMTIDQPALRQIVLDTCAKADLESGYIRLNVTRGTGLGLDPANIDETPNIMVMINSLNLFPEKAYEEGLSAIISAFRVIPPDSLDPRIKCIGRYAANILAKQEGNRAGVHEALMLNHQGYLAEGTGDNLFLIKGRTISTPHPSSGILKGITRDTAIELARKAGYEVVESFLTPYEIWDAEEAFLTGTAAEIVPLVKVDGRPIGKGVPGPITKEIIGMFRDETTRGVPFDAGVGAGV